MAKRVSTVLFINGRGCIYLPKGNQNTRGVKWYEDTCKEAN